MDTTHLNTDPDRTADYERTTVAGVFADRDMAHESIRRLHDEGFRETWIGITRSDDTSVAHMSDAETATGETTRVESDNWFMRMFGEGDETLYDALVKRGVPAGQARRVGSLGDHSAIVTVNGENDPELAAQIITQTGGELITGNTAGLASGSASPYAGSSFGSTSMAAADHGDLGQLHANDGLGMDQYGDDGLIATAPSPSLQMGTPSATSRGLDNAVPLQTGSADSDILPQAPYADETFGSSATTNFNSGSLEQNDSDRERRIQLREERLRVDTERVSRGEATIGKEIVTQQQDISVPLVHEELFIERRPVTGAAAVSSGPAIGEDTEVVRIPLTEERLNVSKVAVVTEEVVVGKRKVEEMGRVVETTRKETLTVDGVDASAAEIPR